MAHKDIDGGWGWVVTFAYFLIAFFIGSANTTFAIVYVILVERFDSSAAQTAWIQALYNIFRFMLAPLATALSDKFGFRPVIIVGGVLYAVGFMLSAFATSVYQLYFTYSVISGIGASLTTNPGNVALVQYFDKKKGKALSLSSMGMEIGIIAMSFTYTFLLNEYGYSGMMLITGALMLNSVIGGALFRQPPKPADSNAKSREMVTMKQGQDTSQTTPKANIEQEKKSCCSSFKERFIVMKNSTFCLYFLNLCVLPFGLQTAVIFILHYCVEIEPSLTKTHLSLIWTLRSISALVGKFVSGFVFDLKFFRGRRRVLHSTIGVAAGVLLMSLSLANSFYVVVVIVVGWGVLIQSFEANSTTSMNEFVPKNLMSSAIGLMMFSRGIGNLLGPYSAGLIKDFTDTYRFVFVYVGVVFTFFCTVFLVEYFVRKAMQQRTAENSQNRT